MDEQYQAGQDSSRASPPDTKNQINLQDGQRQDMISPDSDGIQPPGLEQHKYGNVTIPDNYNSAGQDASRVINNPSPGVVGQEGESVDPLESSSKAVPVDVNVEGVDRNEDNQGLTGSGFNELDSTGGAGVSNGSQDFVNSNYSKESRENQKLGLDNLETDSKDKRLSSRLMYIVLGIVVILLLVGGYFFYNKFFSGNNDDSSSEVDNVEEEEVTEDEQTEILSEEEEAESIKISKDVPEIEANGTFILTINYDLSNYEDVSEFIFAGEIKGTEDISVINQESDPPLVYSAESTDINYQWKTNEKESLARKGTVKIELKSSEDYVAEESIYFVFQIKGGSGSVLEEESFSFLDGEVEDICGDDVLDSGEDFDEGETEGKLAIDISSFCDDSFDRLELSGEGSDLAYYIQSEKLDDSETESVNSQEGKVFNFGDDFLIPVGTYSYEVFPVDACGDNNEGDLEILGCKEILLSDYFLDDADTTPSIIKSINGTNRVELSAGEEATYLIKFSNPRNKAMKNVVIADPFDNQNQEYIEFVSQSSNLDMIFDKSQMSWTIEELAGNANGRIEVKVKVKDRKDLPEKDIEIDNKALIIWEGTEIESETVIINITRDGEEINMAVIVGGGILIVLVVGIIVLLVRRGKFEAIFS